MCVLCRADPHELQLEIEEVRSRQNSPKPWQERGGIIERGLYPFFERAQTSGFVVFFNLSSNYATRMDNKSKMQSKIFLKFASLF